MPLTCISFLLFFAVATGTVQDLNSGSLVTFSHNGGQLRIYQPPVLAQSKAGAEAKVKESVKAAPKDQECFQFTWPGIHLEQNSTVTCKNFTTTSKKNPCYEPFIDYADDDSPPDPFDVYNHCQKNSCPMKITCPLSPTGNCIRYTFYRENKPVNITWFCGTVKDITDNNYLRYGTRRDDLPGGDVLEATFCDSNLCNTSLRNMASTSAAFVLLSLAFFWYR